MAFWSGLWLLYVCLLAVVAGLVVAEIVLRLWPRALGDDYPRRYAAMLAAVCLGGVLLGPLPVLYPALLGDSAGVVRAAGLGLLGLFLGGLVGSIEGLVLASPW